MVVIEIVESAQALRRLVANRPRAPKLSMDKPAEMGSGTWVVGGGEAKVPLNETL